MPVDRSVAREHGNWLALVEVSGTFLSLPILMESYQIRMNTVHLTSTTALRSQFEYAVINRI